MEAVLLALFCDGQWSVLDTNGNVPRATANDRYQFWKADGAFDRIQKLGVKCRDRHGHSWEWLSFIDEIVPDLAKHRDLLEA